MKKNPYVIIRSANAGVFAGNLVSLKDGTATMKNSRRIWYWSGAASLSEMSQHGVSNPTQCKFPCEVPSHVVLGVCEVLYCAKVAEVSIKGVPVWSKK